MRALLASWAGAAVLYWAGRGRPKRAQEQAAASEGVERLDTTTRNVLRAVAEREPFVGGEIPGISPDAALDCLDRLTAMGILKCELTAPAGQTEGTTVWTVHSNFKDAASGSVERAA